ncbi:MAG: radical SAM protein, partial [Oscillochloris sp.]|nr:radical SAM protein [Oscillochloris sp.]
MYGLDTAAAEADEFRRAVAARDAYRPLYVKIKLTFGCNLRCAMCGHWRTQREAPLPIARLHALIDELADLGCRKLHLSGGEPLLRPQVPELVEQASGRGVRVTLTTNGTLVDKALARRLAEAGLRGVNLSLDSPVRKIHDGVRGVAGAWKATLRAARHLARAAPRGKLALRINTVVSRANYRSLATLPDLAHELGAESLNLIGVDGHADRDLLLRPGDLARYNALIAPQIAERALALGLIADAAQAYPFGRSAEELALASRGDYALGFYQRHPCYAPWTHSLVDFNGLVYLCCMTRESAAALGDLRQSTFAEVWHGESYAAARRMMHPPALPQCRTCDNFIGYNRELGALSNNDSAAGQPSPPAPLPHAGEGGISLPGEKCPPSPAAAGEGGGGGGQWCRAPQ